MIGEIGKKKADKNTLKIKYNLKIFLTTLSFK